jgi:hypothetical protein
MILCGGRVVQLAEQGEEPDTTSIARRLAVTEVLKHTAKFVPKALASTISMASGLRRWRKRAGPGADDGGSDGRSDAGADGDAGGGDDVAGAGAGAGSQGGGAAAIAAAFGRGGGAKGGFAALAMRGGAAPTSPALTAESGDGINMDAIDPTLF